MNNWTIAIYIYVVVAMVSFIPVLLAILRKVKLHPGGESFSDSAYFTAENVALLEQHFTRLHGTLIFWKNKAEWNRRFHFYTLCWSIPVSILIPIISQSIDTSPQSKLFLTIISSHTALLFGFHRALKIENNFKGFRHGESEFYDLYRRLLDRPTSFGNSQQEQIEAYFIEVEKIRRIVRLAETDNFPFVEDTKPKQN